MTFFWSKAKGIKADIERHRVQEAELDAKIAKIENMAEPGPMDIAALRTYRRFRAQLQQSRADVVTKIGKKK